MEETAHNKTVPSRDCRSGFTLIELMIVVVVIGILAAIAIPKFTQVSRQAKQAEAGPLMKQIVTLQERYHAKEGSYAADLTLLEGGSTLATSGVYYDFSIDTSHATGYCVVATPNTEGTDAGVSPLSMDAMAEAYDSSTCS